MSKHLVCDCGGILKKIWFEESEYKNGVRTGRVRNAVSHLTCGACLKNVIVDDSFDGSWHYPAVEKQNGM